LPGSTDVLWRCSGGSGESLDRAETALLYKDFYPGNAGIPGDGGPTVLFDWQLVSRGPIHLDICNVGLQSGREGFALVDTGALMEFYLDCLAGETGERLDSRVFRDECRTASLLAWGLMLDRMVTDMRRCNADGKVAFRPRVAGWYRKYMEKWGQAVARGGPPG
jgi:hypothetical protein